MKKCLYKEIRLYPTDFMLDVWVCDNQKKLCDEFNKKYGASLDYYYEWLTQNQVATITDIKGYTRIVMNIDNFDLNTIVHESNHVLHHLNNLCHLGVGNKCQEWASYFITYVFNEITNKKTYVEK